MSPFHFLLFQGNLQNQTCLKGPPLEIFRHCATFFSKLLNVPKGSPLRVFWNFATKSMLINPKWSPPLHFLALCDIFRKKKIQKFQVFSQKNVLRFLSLRYSADFRRSRLFGFNSAIFVKHKMSYSHNDTFFFCTVQTSQWKVHFSQKLRKLERSNPASGKLVQMVPACIL